MWLLSPVPVLLRFCCPICFLNLMKNKIESFIDYINNVQPVTANRIYFWKGDGKIGFQDNRLLQIHPIIHQQMGKL